MNSDNTRQWGPPHTSHRGRESDTHSSHVVLVADSDPEITDDVAELLRDGYVVRTAYTSEAVLSSVDDDVSVVLLDPALPDLLVDDVIDRLADGGNWRVAALTERRPADDRFDGHVSKPVARESLMSTVDRLCHCVAYRDTLDRYYDVAQARATLSSDDPQLDRLDSKLSDIEVELGEVAESIDSDDAYEAALREPAGDR